MTVGNSLKKKTEEIYLYPDFDICEFNKLGNANAKLQLDNNIAGIINTWGVFWAATIFKNKGYNIFPRHSMTNNIGLDGTGTNCGKCVQDNSLAFLNTGKINVEMLCEYSRKNEILMQKWNHRISNYLKFRRLCGRLKRLLYSTAYRFTKKNGIS